MNSKFHATAFDGTRLKQLRFVLEVAQRGSLAEAAEALHMTSSAASMLLRSVEQALGGQLFERSAHGMVPTARARSLMPRLRALMGEADALAAAAASGELLPTVRIGFIAHVSATVLPKVVVALVGGSAPRRVQLIEGRAAVLAEMLHEAKLDFVVGKMPSDFPAGKLAGLEFHPLYQDGIAVVARKGHALCGRRHMPHLNELRDATWVLPPAGSTTQAAFVEAWLRAGMIPPQPAVECPSYLYGLELIRASDMLTCCAMSAAKQSKLAITILETPLQLSPLPVGLFWRSGSAAAEDLAPLLRTIAF